MVGSYARELVRRPFRVERDDMLPAAARRFNAITGTALIVLTAIVFFDAAAYTEPIIWLLAAVTAYLVTHRLHRASGFTDHLLTPLMIAAVVYGPAAATSIIVLAIPILALTPNESWRHAGRLIASAFVCGTFVVWLVAFAEMLIGGNDSPAQLVVLAAAACLADLLALVIYFGPLFRFVEGREFSFSGMIREQWTPTALQSLTETSAVGLGALAITQTPFAWALFVAPCVMLFHDSKLMLAQSQLLERLATDELTSVRSRSGWHEDVRTACASDSTRPTSVIMADLDHFKQVNDRWGHHVGDEVLRAAAAAIVAALGEAAIVGRFGGEEFMIAMSGSEEAVASSCERMRVAVADALAEWGTTISIGIATLSSIEHLDDAIERADIAMYLAKSSGRNRLTRYDDEIGPIEIRMAA